jgi:uncharacterized repeat protein (TIGR01451 family)
MTPVLRALSILIAAAAILAAGTAIAQSQAGQNQEIQLPPGSPVISISAMMPQELRVGEQFEYQIQIRNLSDDVAIHDLVLQQQKSDALQIESARVDGGQDSPQRSNQQSRQNNQESQQQNQQPGQQAQQKGEQSQRQVSAEQGADNASQQAANRQQQSQPSQDSPQQGQEGQQQNQWTIAMLGPGEQRTIHVTAIAEKEGQANACLLVTDFKPSLCLRTEFVKPDLELVKNAPAEANLCDEIKVDYYVKNIGSGNAGRFVIRDPLGKGLKTVDGDDKLEFAVDGLEEGEVRKFVATLRAERAGQFASRAIAEMEKGGKTNSNKIAIEVRQADLAVQIDGPDAHYLGRPANYTILVANRGNAPATNAVLRADFAEGADVIRSGEPQAADAGALRQGSQQPTPAGATDQKAQAAGENQQASAQQQSSQQQSAQRQGQSANQATIDADKSWELGTLAPGQAVKIPVTLRFRQPGTLKSIAVAEFACGDGRNRDAAHAVAQQQTELIALPDLLLAVVDDEGTVPKGEQVSYTIIVKNQGEAADQDVQITAELPEGLEFVSADGPTDPQNEGGTLTFAPVKSLEPGNRVVYRVTTKAAGEGQVLFRTTLSSKNMTQPATEEEPTRLIAQTAQAEGEAQQQ